MEVKRKISDFTDLIVWQEGHKLVLSVYKHTSALPKTEAFGLSSQMQRCVVSVTSNIAEGFARRTKRDKIQFYYMALSSLSELRNQLIICRDLKYITKNEEGLLQERCIRVRMLLNGLVKSSIEYS